MKTISGESISTKQVSLSKAAKILSKFVAAENGASQVISAYLHRASNSFNELNQLHKELRSSRSHQKHKRQITEAHDDRERLMENSIWSIETNQKMNHGPVQSKNKFRGHQDDGKITQTVVRFSQESNGTIGYNAGNVGGSEKLKKNKKKKQKVESRDHLDSRVEFGEKEVEGKLPTGNQNEVQSSQKLSDEGEGNTMEEGKKRKREEEEEEEEEKKKKKKKKKERRE